jgi:hypothetical protein
MGYDYKTSLPAYNEAKQTSDYCRQKVFFTIKKLGACTDKMIADSLGWPINRVTPRRGELVTNGLIINAGKMLDEKSNRTVNFWKEKKVEILVQKDLFIN